VAIIGLGCLFPGADGAASYWANIKARADTITEVPPSHWRPEDYLDPDPKAPDRVYCARGGFIPPVEFHPLEFGISPHTLEATDSTQLLRLVVAREALRDAGYGPGGAPLDRARVGVILGVTGALELVIPLGARLGHPIWRRALKEAGVESVVAEDVVARIADAYVPWQENSFPGLLGNVVAGRIASRLDLGGTNCVVDAACASSIAALHLALLELETGRCEVALSGGLDTFNDIFMYSCFSKTPALSPSGHARPFDDAGDGTVLGEGLGVVVLKRLEDAKRDKDRIYAVIRGVGASSDGKGQAIYAPSAAGQVKALRAAYASAGISPASVELVEAHGTGTRVGDRTEVTALTEVFRSARADGTWCALGSVKSQIGHTKAAAGAAGLIKAVLALHSKVLPPTIKVEQPLDVLQSGRAPFYVNTEKRPWLPRPGHPRRAAVSAFGFGGSNFHCVLEEASAEKLSADWDGDVQVVPLGAASTSALYDLVAAWPFESASGSVHRLRAEAKASRASWDAKAQCRLVFVLRSGKTDFLRLRDLALARLKDGRPERRWAAPEGAYFAAGPVSARGKLAFLFPGQGSQHVGMLRDLACQFPEALQVLTNANASFSDGKDIEHGRRLTDLIYPCNPFDAAARDAQESALRDTRIAQPALGAVSLAAFRVLERFGLTPEIVAGHSFGELTALAAAGWLDGPSLFRLARLRGELMAQGTGDRGTMLAVAAPLAEVEEMVARAGRGLVLANRNAPEQAVVSGPSEAIASFSKELDQRGLRSTRLPVSAAFHSSIVAPASRPLADALRGVVFAPTPIGVHSNTTGRPYPDDPEQARHLLAGQLASPVDFVREVRSMHESGARVFLEVGPSNKITGLVSAILAGEDHAAVALDASNGKSSGIFDLARALAQVAALGFSVDWTKWDESYDPSAAPAEARPGVTVRLTGANYVKPRKPAPATNGRTPPQAPRAADPSKDMTAMLRPEPIDTDEPPALVRERELSPLRETTAPLEGPIERPSSGLPPAHAIERAIDESLAAILHLQAQAVELHRRFLDGQEAAFRTIQTLVEAQSRAVIAPDASDRGARADLPRAIPAASAAEPFAARPIAPSGPAAVYPGTDYAEMVYPETVPSIAVHSHTVQPTAPCSAPIQDSAAPPPVAPPNVVPAGSLERSPAREPSTALGRNEPAAKPVDAPESPAPQAAAGPRAEVARVLREVVAEKTGYPAEMLEPSMSLDADLGIDSIKRVEIFSALRERLPSAPEVTPADLPRLSTLEAIVDFLDQPDAQALGAQSSRPGADPAALGGAPGAPGEATSKASTRKALLEVVAEKTGYPAEMLEPSMSLDADLGIDSIKRVEIFSALRERLPSAPEVTPADLPRLSTLDSIVDFLARAAEAEAPAASPEPHVAPSPQPDVAPRDVFVSNANASARAPETPAEVRTRTSAPTVAARDGIALERSVLRAAPLPDALRRRRFSFEPGAEVWLTSGDALAGNVAARLRFQGLTVTLAPAEDLLARPVPGALSGLIIVASREPSKSGSALARDAFLLLQRAAPALRTAAVRGPALFVSVTWLDGSFGVEGPIAGDPTTGSLAGLVKTVAREWPEVHCKALDISPEPAASREAIALTVADEICLDGPVEVGIDSQHGARSLELVAAPLEAAAGAEPPCAPGEVVVLSGGARGVTAEAAVGMAARWRARLLLLGRSPAPAAEPSWLAGAESEAEMKRAIAQRLGAGAPPRAVAEEYARHAANREIRATLARIEAEGVPCLYRSADVRDAAAVGRALAEARATLGPVRVLVHAAGVIADRRIEEKRLEQFEQVFSTKVEGLRVLLDQTRVDDLRAIAVFSSSTGRFGRAGQIDYAAANEAVNKLAQAEARKRPKARVISVNWGPWEGGMVTPALRRVFEAEGVGLIPLEDGARHLLRELETPRAPGAGDVEVVLLRRERGAASPRQHPPAAGVQMNAPHSEPFVLDASQGEGKTREAFRIELSLARHPFLESHVMNGKAVLPAAVVADWLAHGALHEHPGLVFRGFDELRIFKGVIIGRQESALLRVVAGEPQLGSGGSEVSVPMELWTGEERSGRLNARASILLASSPAQPAGPPLQLLLLPYERSGPIYDGARLFHGPQLQVIERVDGCGDEGITAQVRSGAPPAAWISKPLRSAWIADPSALDAAFQLLILWSFENCSIGCLPSAVGSYRQFQRAYPRDGVRLVARVERRSVHALEARVDIIDRTGRPVARLDRCECVLDGSLQAAFARNQLDREPCP